MKEIPPIISEFLLKSILEYSDLSRPGMSPQSTNFDKYIGKLSSLNVDNLGLIGRVLQRFVYGNFEKFDEEEALPIVVIDILVGAFSGAALKKLARAYVREIKRKNLLISDAHDLIQHIAAC